MVRLTVGRANPSVMLQHECVCNLQHFALIGGPDVCLYVTADPFLNDANFIVSVLSLEELGATGNKVSTLLRIWPYHCKHILLMLCSQYHNKTA